MLKALEHLDGLRDEAAPRGGLYQIALDAFVEVGAASGQLHRARKRWRCEIEELCEATACSSACSRECEPEALGFRGPLPA